MKHTIIILVILVTSTLKGFAQDEKQVAEAVEKLRTAMLNGDRKMLDELAAKELSYGHSSGKIEDKASFVESLASGQSDFISIELKEQTISVTGNTALVRHKLYGEVVDGGKAANVALGILLVWQKQKGQWKLLARQAFRLAI